MREELLDLPVIGRAGTLQSVDEDSRTFDVLWTTGAQVRRYSWARDEEFDEELVVSPNAMRLDRLNGGAPFLNSHSSWSLRSILGVVEDGSIRIEGGQAFARIRLSERDEVEDIWRDIKGGIIRHVSVGYRVHKFERIAKADRKDGGKRALYRAVDWEPLEISAVAIGADPGAGMRSDAGQHDSRRNSCTLITRSETATPAEDTTKKGNIMADENIQAGGDESRTAEETGTPEAPAQPAPTAPDAESIRTEERTRVSTIMSLCERHGLSAEFSGNLITQGTPIDAARSLILDELAASDPRGRSVEPAPAQARDGQAGLQYREAVSNALLHRANTPGVEVSDAGRAFRGMSLMEIARHSLERSGVNTRGMGRMEIAAAALSQRAVGYHTTGDFPAVLANIGNITLREAYRTTPRTFTAWARRTTLSDFRPTTRVQVSNAPQLEKVPEGAEFKYGTFGEASTQYGLATYGKIIAFSRQMLINDDLGAFTRVTSSFGARAAQLEGDLVYAILLQNPAMSDGQPLFHADHRNLGSASAISEAALIEAYEAFAGQTDIDGSAIDVSPEIIIVPPGQRAVEARKLLTATTPANTGDVNTFANRMQVVEERRLMPGSSGEAPWFLAAGTGLIDTVEYAYLDGQDGVFTETRNGFEVDGVEIKARLDFAAAAIDWRGLYKNAGAAPAAP